MTKLKSVSTASVLPGLLFVLIFLLEPGTRVQSSSARVTVDPANGWLVLDGGGIDRENEAGHKFAALAGGINARVVVVVTPIDLDVLTPDFFTKYRQVWETEYGVPNVTFMDARDRLVAAGDCGCRPAASTNIVDEGGRTNACCTAVNQMRKGVRVEPTRTPVPHDHRRCRTAAQRFGLGDEWNVENGERAARLSALRRSDTQHDGQQHAEGSHVDRAPHHRTAGRLTATRVVSRWRR